MTALDPRRLVEHFGRLPPPGRRTAPGRDLPLRGDHNIDAAPVPGSNFDWPPLQAAAVLVPIVAMQPEPTLLFTLRTEHLRAHAGQISSFPGGRLDPGDPSPEAAALREAAEEIGLDPKAARILGRLDTYLTATGFEVTPVVALLQPPLTLRLDPNEVAEVFEVPLAYFLLSGSRQLMSGEFQGQMRQYYAYPYGERLIWGATAGMLNNLAEVLAGLAEG